jgi:hypothetical protein
LTRKEKEEGKKVSNRRGWILSKKKRSEKKWLAKLGDANWNWKGRDEEGKGEDC